MLINVVTHCCMFTIWQEIIMAIMKFEYCVSCVDQPQLIHGHWQTTSHIRATTPPTTFEPQHHQPHSSNPLQNFVAPFVCA